MLVSEPGLEVVDADHAVAAVEQLVAQVRAEEAGAAGDEASGHTDSIPRTGPGGPGRWVRPSEDGEAVPNRAADRRGDLHRVVSAT